MRQGEPAFGHHLGEISKAELVSQIPAHAEHDDLLVKVPALEESSIFVCARQLCRSTDLPTTMLCPSSSHQSQGCRHPLKADPMAPLAPIASMAVSGLPCTSQQKAPRELWARAGQLARLGGARS